MKAKDKIAKATWTLLEGMKDQVRSDLIASVQSGLVKVEKDQIERLVHIVTTSMDAGYHKAFRTFDRVVTKAIEEIPVTTPEPSTKKNLQSGNESWVFLRRFLLDQSTRL